MSLSKEVCISCLPLTRQAIQKMAFNIFLSLSLLIITPSVFAAVAGKTLTVTGEVSAVRTGGEVRVLRGGSPVYGGDKIITALDASTQLRLQDGSLINLFSESDFRIESYELNANKSKLLESFFSLVKGGFRSLTGALVQRNKKAYRLKTPVATIGIRGTDYAIRLCSNDCPPGYLNGVFISVFDGALKAETASKTYEIKSGENVFIPGDREPMQYLPSPPEILSPEPTILGEAKRPKRPGRKPIDPRLRKISFQSVERLICIK
jgi:hypothetical protein